MRGDQKVKSVFIRLLLIFISIFLISSITGLTVYVFPELKYFSAMPLPKNYSVTVEGVRLGQYLFYDPGLSKDSSLSCSSCHLQSHAFSDAGMRFSKGRNGTLMKRNTPALYNLAWFQSYFWDGRAASLEEQIFHPITSADEMNFSLYDLSERLNKNYFYKKKFKEVFQKNEIDSLQIAMALSQFLRSLISHESKYDQVIAGKAYFSKEEYQGFVLANEQTKGDCLHCHPTDGYALGTTGNFSNNGLDSVMNADNFPDKGRGEITHNREDNGKFKIPSLRNLVFTAPYMHDGRFRTLEEVLLFYSEQVYPCANIDSKMRTARNHGLHLSSDEQKKIVAFLKTMSDSVFIHDPKYCNPFLD